MERPALWQKVEAVLEGEGLRLFDMDLPGSGAGMLTIYIAATDAGVRVTPDDCVRASRALDRVDEEKPFLPDHANLVVSSPGINRRLRYPEQFVGAVGERVKVSCRAAQQTSRGPQKVFTGTLLAFDGSVLEIEDETAKEKCRVSFDEISKARVDCLF